jgi:hypothetical protein
MFTSPQLSGLRLSVSNKPQKSDAIGMPLPIFCAQREFMRLGLIDGHRQTAHSIHAYRYSFRIAYTQ